jgi:hypothetical protein
MCSELLNIKLCNCSLATKRHSCMTNRPFKTKSSESLDLTRIYDQGNSITCENLCSTAEIVNANILTSSTNITYTHGQESCLWTSPLNVQVLTSYHTIIIALLYAVCTGTLPYLTFAVSHFPLAHLTHKTLSDLQGTCSRSQFSWDMVPHHYVIAAQCFDISTPEDDTTQ